MRAWRRGGRHGCHSSPASLLLLCSQASQWQSTEACGFPPDTVNKGGPSAFLGFSGGSVGKESGCNAGDAEDTSLIPRSGRSPGGGHGNPLQYSCLENPMDRGAWWVTVHGVAKRQTRLKQLRSHIHSAFLIMPESWRLVVQGRGGLWSQRCPLHPCASHCPGSPASPRSFLS